METKGPVRQTISPEEASRLLAPTDGNRAFSEKQVTRLKEDIIDDDNGDEFNEVAYEVRAIDAEASADERADHYQGLGFVVEIVKPAWM